MNDKFETREKLLIAILILLCGPALLVNLGLMTNIDDEAIRSLVAMEMTYSGNYLAPTLNGEYYYNKPPLFNWILLFWFKLFGNYGELAARFQTVVAVLGFAATIFFSFEKRLGAKLALLTALSMVTCGRVIFWDSLLSLIDITFSWVIFGLFMLVYQKGEKEKFLQLFLLAYFLTAIGFLLKGLPALVFLAGTFFAYFVLMTKKWKKLFSFNHLTGLAVFGIIIGTYYLLYFQENELNEVFPTLFSESSKRTALHLGIKESIIHFFTFPFEMVYHFLPWSLLSIFLLHKKSLRWIRENHFITYLSLVFLVNIFVYWISPEVYPRYLIMFCPLYFGVLFYLYDKHVEASSIHPKLLYIVFSLFMIILGLGALAIPFLDRLHFLNDRLAITALLLGMSLPLMLIYFRWRPQWLLAMVAMLLVFRLGFNLLILPDRNSNDYGNELRLSAIEAGKYFSDKDLSILGVLDVNPSNSYYLSRESGRTVQVSYGEPKAGSHYIIDPNNYQGPPYEKLFELKVRHPKKQIFYIIKIIE